MQLHRKIEINMPTKTKIKQKTTGKRSGAIKLTNRNDDYSSLNLIVVYHYYLLLFRTLPKPSNPSSQKLKCIAKQKQAISQ